LVVSFFISIFVVSIRKTGCDKQECRLRPTLYSDVHNCGHNIKKTPFGVKFVQASVRLYVFSISQQTHQEYYYPHKFV